MFLTVEGGLLGPIAWLLGVILNWIYNLLSSVGIENIGLCIILFTFITKIIMFPLTFKQQKSSKINAYIQPEIQKIQKKYKGKTDNESMMKMNRETQDVYRKYGTSMTGGCLPTLIQFPIMFALIRVIYNIPGYVKSINSLYEPIANEIMKTGDYATVLQKFVTDNKISLATSFAKNLVEKADTATSLNIVDVIDKFSTSQWELFQGLYTNNEALINVIQANIPKITEINQFFTINISEHPALKLMVDGNFNWALLIPILSGLFQYLASKTLAMPQNDDPSQAAAGTMMKSMNVMMPLMTVVFCFTFPSGVGLYWVASALFSLIVQLVINFYYDHCDMEKIIAKNIEKAAKKNAKRGNKKTFMERMMEASTGAASTEAGASNPYINKVANTSLKNIDNASAMQNANQNRKGSIASKANIMKQYEDKGGKQ